MSKLRVLVVDDATFIREFIKKGLSDKFPQFTIHEAVNGREAQGRLQEHNYDIVLCDWEMPEMSGEELLLWVREQESLKRLPFIMVTSRGDRDHVVKAVKAGASNYVVKPFTIEALLQKMAQALKAPAPGPAPSPVPRSAAPVAARGPAADSVAILTQGRATPPPKRAMPASDSVAILTGGARPKPAAAAAPRPTVHLRFGDKTVHSVLKNITLTGVEAVVRREDPLPNLLEPIVVDIEASQANEIMRMNAFVHRIQASQPTLNAPQIQIHIRFADDDPVKSENLSKFITHLR